MLTTSLLVSLLIALWPQTAAAGNGYSAGDICGAAGDADGSRNLMTMQQRADGQGGTVLVCALDENMPLPAQPSSPSTIEQLFGNAPSHLTGQELQSWCVSTLYQNAHHVPRTGSHPDGTSTDEIHIRSNRANNDRTLRFDDPVVEHDDLVAGEIGCSAGLFD